MRASSRRPPIPFRVVARRPGDPPALVADATRARLCSADAATRASNPLSRRPGAGIRRIRTATAADGDGRPTEPHVNRRQRTPVPWHRPAVWPVYRPADTLGIVLLLLALCIWAFCRFYYFLLYVLEKYVGVEGRYAGVWDLFSGYARVVSVVVISQRGTDAGLRRRERK